MYENLGIGLGGQTCDGITVLSEHALYTGKAYLISKNPNRPQLKYQPLLQLTFASDNIGKAYKYHYELGILGTWHLLKNAISICAYFGALDRDGQLHNNLNQILNRTVSRVVFIEEKLNLFLEFDNGIWLGIFHTEGVVSGFHLSERHGKGVGGGGTNWYIQNGRIDIEWWKS